MIYLLDVNALVALGVMNHEFHRRISSWFQSHSFKSHAIKSGNLPDFELATCSITELGFVRVLAQAPAYGFSVVQAREFLLRLKNARGGHFTFIADQSDISHLPAWVKWAKQITDGHLSALAMANGAILATLDENIPKSFLIPG
jgi:predicted nucleic acid-binding protein